MKCSTIEVFTSNHCNNISDRATTFGDITTVAAASRWHRQLKLAYFLRGIKVPMDLLQYQVYYNGFGQVVGYVTWAEVSPAVLRKLISNPRESLQIFEWNEGGSLWVIDFLAQFGSLQYVLADMRDRLFKQFDSITYAREKAGRLVVKQISRGDPVSFFKAASTKQS